MQTCLHLLITCANLHCALGCVPVTFSFVLHCFTKVRLWWEIMFSISDVWRTRVELLRTGGSERPTHYDAPRSTPPRQIFAFEKYWFFIFIRHSLVSSFWNTPYPPVTPIFRRNFPEWRKNYNFPSCKIVSTQEWGYDIFYKIICIVAFPICWKFVLQWHSLLDLINSKFPFLIK